MPLSLLLVRHLRLGRAADEPAVLDLEPARLQDGLPEVEGDGGDAFDGGDLFLFFVCARVRVRLRGRACAPSSGSGGFCVLDLG